MDNIEQRNGRYTELVHFIWWTCVPTHNRVDLWRNLCTSLLYFVVRVRCRRRESSRSLSHLPMSFLLIAAGVNLPILCSISAKSSFDQYTKSFIVDHCSVFTSDNSALFSCHAWSQRFVAIISLYGLSSTHASRQ